LRRHFLFRKYLSKESNVNAENIVSRSRGGGNDTGDVAIARDSTKRKQSGTIGTFTIFTNKS